MAYIFVHGIVGTPNHFDFLMEYVPEDVSVWKLVLDGHGGSNSLDIFQIHRNQDGCFRSRIFQVLF